MGMLDKSPQNLCKSLENDVEGENSIPPRLHTVQFPFIQNSQNGRTLKTGNNLAVARHWGNGAGGRCCSEERAMGEIPASEERHVY